VQFSQGWRRTPCAHGAPVWWRHARALLFKSLELPDAPQGLLGYRDAAGGMHVEQLWAGMGHASELGRACCK
jgi:hypothetical protein